MINGIKPTITTTTKLRIKPTSFNEAMEKFCEKLTENVKPEVDKFSHMHSVTFGVDGGRKYIKVKSYTKNWHTDYNDDGTTNYIDQDEVDANFQVHMNVTYVAE